MSQLVESQLNPLKASRKKDDPAQSSAIRNGDNPEVKDSEQVAESRAQPGIGPLERPKPAIEEELQALLGETRPPFPDHILMDQPPKGFVLFKIDLYNGKSNPTEHLNHGPVQL